VKLYTFDAVPNFGDQLNGLIWDKLLPGCFAEDSAILFLGIGTLLNGEMPRAKRIAILGTGAGYGTSLSHPEPNWEIYCVRGPLTAMALGLSTATAASDPAILIQRLHKPIGGQRSQLGFMPHWKSASAEHEALCNEHGIRYIDPRREVGQVIEAIACSEILVTEALHGAIVADSLRVPWVAVHDRRNDDTLLFKWQDWCLSVGLDHQPNFLSEEQTCDREIRRLARVARPRLSRSARFDQAVTRLDVAVERLKTDLELGKFR